MCVLKVLPRPKAFSLSSSASIEEAGASRAILKQCCREILSQYWKALAFSNLQIVLAPHQCGPELHSQYLRPVPLSFTFFLWSRKTQCNSGEIPVFCVSSSPPVLEKGADKINWNPSWYLFQFHGTATMMSSLAPGSDLGRCSPWQSSRQLGWHAACTGVPLGWSPRRRLHNPPRSALLHTVPVKAWNPSLETNHCPLQTSFSPASAKRPGQQGDSK